MITGLIIGFFIGSLAGGWYASWFTRRLIKNGYAKFEVTDKFRNDFDLNKSYPCEKCPSKISHEHCYECDTYIMGNRKS